MEEYHGYLKKTSQKCPTKVSNYIPKKFKLTPLFLIVAFTVPTGRITTVSAFPKPVWEQ